MLLFAAFAGTFTILAGAILLVFRPSTQERTLHLRMRGLRGNSQPASATAQTEALLKQSQGELDSPMQNALSRFPLLARVEAGLHRLDPSMPVNKLLLLCCGSGIGGSMLAFVLLPVPSLTLPAGAAATCLPVLVLLLRRRRRIAAFNATLPDAVEMMARSLRAGHALAAALGIVAEHAPEPARTQFSEVFRQQNFGLPLRDAMLQMLDRVPSQDLRVLVTGILVQKDTGGNLAEILDRIVSVIRERLKIQAEIRTHTAQGRMTGWILCLLPLVMFLVMNLIEPGYFRAFTGNALGAKLLYGGFALVCLGAFVIHRIVSSIEV